MVVFLRKQHNRYHYPVAWWLLFLLIMIPAPSFANPTIPGFYGSAGSPGMSVPPANQLPVLDQVVQGADLEKVADNNLVVHQDQEKAIINWQSFDIGANAWTHFDQQGHTDWTALNRIYDQNPSQVYGRLTADGRVFLVNQNGILFGPGSQVNVHSLVGSALSLSDADFYAGNLSFRLDNFTGQNYDNSDNLPEDSCVANHGTIETDQGGWIFLMAPNVENSGTISAPFGQVGLAAGTEVQLEYEQEYNPESSRTARLVNVKDGGGIAANLNTGRLIADMGMAGMYGRIVNQDGLVRSVTAVEKDGNIELIASHKIALGPDSMTTCPVSDSTEEVHESFTFQGGDIQIHSHDPENPRSDRILPTERIEISGSVEAPSGIINVSASERIYMESNSRLDVGGSIVTTSASDTMIEAQLNSVEMRDDYGQKEGIMQGEYIAFNTLEGSSIGDISSHLVSEEKTAGEFSTTGGEIYLTCATGDIIIKENAGIDFSGGGIYFASGAVETTKLVSGHRVYDISSAPQWIEYDQMLDGFQKTYARFGMMEEFEGIHYGGPGAFKELTTGYFHGDDAGRLELVAPQIVLDGYLDGSVVSGVFQTEISEEFDENGSQVSAATTRPIGGTLVVGARAEGNEWTSPEQNKVVAEIVVQETVAPSSDLTADSRIPAMYADTGTLDYANGETVPKTYLGADKLNAAGLDTIELNANTRLTIEPDASLSLSPGGALLAWARQIRIDGDISIPSGAVTLKANESYTAAEELLAGGNVFDDQNADTIENGHYIDMPGGIILGETSRITVAGERIDNTWATLDEDHVLQQGWLDGGDIHLIDQTDSNFYEGDIGLVVPGGAKLDVSGGYQMDPGGILNGGGAGEIKLVAADMVLDGELRGYSLQGYDGGTIRLLAKKLNIVHGDGGTDAEALPEGMVLADDRFVDFGFTHYSLESLDDLTVAEGVTLVPSMMKLVDPYQSENMLEVVPTSQFDETVSSDIPSIGDMAYEVMEIQEEFLGDSSIRLWASINFENVTTGAPVSVLSRIYVEPDARIRVAPTGTISLDATGIEMAGTLSAPAGSIALTTDGQDEFDLKIADTGRILARGFNLPGETSMIDGQPVTYTPLDAGQVSLTASAGDVSVDEGAVIDVSGSEPIEQLLTDAGGEIDTRLVAGNPGGITFSFLNSLDIQSGESLKASGRMPGIQGGSLTIQKTDEIRGLVIESSHASETAAEGNSGEEQTGATEPDDAFDEPTIIELDRIVTPETGFDEVSLVSASSIRFDGNQSIETGRKITIDAPLIFTDDAADVQLTSPWVTLANNDFPYSGTLDEGLLTGEATFNVTADWIDLIGDVRFSGFGNEENGGVELDADYDIRLSDSYYTTDSGGGSTLGWSGRLTVPGQLGLTAARIYPTTQSAYTLESGGTITTRHSGLTPTGPVYSAGGQITLLADRINHQGTLMAPMGQIVMARSVTEELVDGKSVTTYQPAGRIFLAPDSRISTQGETQVNFGTFDEDGIDWFFADKAGGEQYAGTQFAEAPENRIQVIGDEVILRPGSHIDASGGGELFAYLFLPGIEGSSNPLSQNSQYVILPDNRIKLPGTAVYLEGVEGLPDGTYHLLPDEFAFMPDAIVIRDIGVNVSRERHRLTDEGYAIATGYTMIPGTDIQSPVLHEYEIRPAEDVLAEGNFTVDQMICGDAGQITVQGNTTIINGDISGSPLPADPATGYDGGEGGILTLSGKEVRIGEAADQVDIVFSHEIAEQYQNILSVGSDTFSDSDLGEIRIGNEMITESITFSEGSRLKAGSVTLIAKDEIRLSDGVDIDAAGEDGVAEFTAGHQLVVDGSAHVHATDNVIIDTNQLNLGNGRLEMDDSTLTLQSDAIYLASSAYEADGLVMTPAVWNQITGASTIEMESRSDVFFKGQVDLTVDQGLSLEAARLVGLDGASVNLSAATVTLSGNETSGSATGAENNGTMHVQAAERFFIQDGDMLMAGFSDIHFESAGEMTFSGEGGLETSGGDLTLTAVRLDTTSYRPTMEADDVDATGIENDVPIPEFADYIPADYSVDAGNGDVTIATAVSGEGAETPVDEGTSVPGGRLQFTGKSIEIGAPVVLPAGRLTVTAHEDGIAIVDGGSISLPGTDAAPGGIAVLTAENSGAIYLAGNTFIDVSSGSQGDAGTVKLSAPEGGVDLGGDLIATASGGRGGSFFLDTYQLSQLSAVTSHLDGFNRSMNIRSRDGHVTVDTDIETESFKLTVDGGDINLEAGITANGDTDGGRVELNAGNDLNLAAGSHIDVGAGGADGDGGSIFLNAAAGDLWFWEGAEIVASGNGSGLDGSVLFRAKREGVDDVRMHLAGTVIGASEILAEAVAVYENISSIDSAYMNVVNNETQSYMNAVAAGTTIDDLLNSLTVQDRNGAVLGSAAEADRFHMMPGVEILSPEDGGLTLEDTWTLTNRRYNGEPGALTLRSAGDLAIEADLNDSPTMPTYNLPGEPGTDSWEMRLTAGADLASADIMATASDDSSTLSISPEKKVYTESGQLWFATGGDATIYAPKNAGSSVQPLSLGTYDGNISGIINGDLNLIGGVIQSATGDIRIDVYGDLNMTTGGVNHVLGAVRTTGQMPDVSLYPDITPFFVSMRYWEYSNGGDIDIHIAGDVNGEYALEAWDSIYQPPVSDEYFWAANYEGISATQGLATMGGGSLTVHCGGDFLGQAGTFGEGDLGLYAGGNMDGRFLVCDGIGRLSTMGSLGTLPNLDNQTIEIMDARVWVDAQGHINLGAVINPTIAGTATNQNLYTSLWDLTYSYEGQSGGAKNSAVFLTSHSGDVVLTGQSAFGINDIDIASQAPYKLLPPEVSIEAAGDIYFQNDFVLAPSPTGSLMLNAGHNIYGQYLVNDQIKKSWIQMPDVAPDLVYGFQEARYNNMKEEMITHLLLVRNYINSPDQPLHQNDPNPVSIAAGNDIQNLKLFLPKKADIYAGNDIVDLYYEGQNIQAGDVTCIQAGNSILYTSEAFTITDPYKGITHGGPGLLWVSAKNRIDLGTTDGIQTVGNLVNPILPDAGSQAIIVAGYEMDKEEAELRGFFNEVQNAGVEYSNMLAEGDPEAADQIVQALHDTVIDPFFADAGNPDVPDGSETVEGQTLLGENPENEGELNMVRSQISSQGENGDLFVISRNNMNVGLTTFNQDADVENTGIFTAGGGDIFAFAGGDINVNESRMMTFYGGDITVWSDAGNINAGRGSKTAVSATPAAATKNEAGEYEVKFKPPAVGSGIRTMTFDPDGASGSDRAPVAGDVYLFAPSGEIDAGEAGISGSNVILGAVSVVNVQNISFSQGAVGVPSASEATATVGALTGGGGLSEAGKMADASAAIQAANKQFEQDAKAMEKTFMPTWLRVEFMGFDIEDREWSEEDES